MTLDFTKRHIMLSILLIVLFIGLVAGAYYLLIQPEKDKLSQKESDLEMVQKELTIVETKQQQLADETIKSSMELQKQVPVKPLLDQLLIDIEKAEVLSESQVLHLSVGSTAEEVAIPKEDEETEEEDTAKEEQEDIDLEGLKTGEGTTETDESDEQEATEAEGEKNTEDNDPFLPEGMKMVTVNITVSAENYFDMERFIDVLQSLQRIVKIDSFRFTGQEEIKLADDSHEPIEFDLTVSAFYYPTLVSLQKELPQMDVPETANKRNPFSTFTKD